MALAFSATAASAQFADESSNGSIRTLHRFGESPSWLRQPAERAPAMPPRVYRIEGAPFVKLHFSRFDLPEGVFVEVSGPESGETWRYSASWRDPVTTDAALGDDGERSFWAMSVSGDTAVVRLTGDLSQFDPARHGFVIDTWFAGTALETAPAVKTRDDRLETNCGESELYDAICWAESHPDEYERASPVALIISTSGKKCTAWRAGSSNRMFTARHCIASQSELDGAEIWFDFQAEVCGGDSSGEIVKVTGGDLLAEDYHLDFSLFTVDDFSRISGFGNLGLDVRDGDIGEGIFIPQHGLGRPKQIAIESDMNIGGLCEIDDNDMDGFSAGSDIGYMCDTTTASSGAPVISASTGRAIALHHWGGCYNSGTKLARIWPEVAEYFNGVVPKGDASGDWDEPNEAPVARLSADCDGLECRLDASASSDPDGSIESLSWNIDGTDYEGETVEHRFADAGDYTVTLTVTDNEGATDRDSETLSVSPPNDAPTARFSTYCVATACTFDGGASDDADGSVVDWSWRFGDGATASGERVEHEFAEAGSYTVRLTVRDDDDAEHSRSQSVSVTVPNEAPVARFELSCDDKSCTVNADASSDADGEIADYSWEFGDGVSADGTAASHEYAAAGEYTIRLVVTDDDGASDTALERVVIEDPNSAPEARFDGSCSDGVCRFDASASTDSDGDIVRYAWAFGDGRQANGTVVEHEYDKDGSYEVTLTVTDDDGARNQASSTFEVTLPEPEPEADFSVNCAELNCTLDAGSSVTSSGTIAQYDWAFGDGTTATGSQVSHEYDRPGRYVVTLKITDSNKASSSRTRVIEVEAREPLTLSADTSFVKDRPVVTLDWSNALAVSVAVYRNGAHIATVPNTGRFVDDTLKPGAASPSYRVCETHSGQCSNAAKPGTSD